MGPELFIVGIVLFMLLLVGLAALTSEPESTSETSPSGADSPLSSYETVDDTGLAIPGTANIEHDHYSDVYSHHPHPTALD